MASGFDATAFDTGLLGGINDRIARQQKDVETGDTSQFQEFQKAAEDYQKSKDKVADQKTKIEAMANVISGGTPDAAAYSTARDAVEMGYTDQVHLPFVQDAYSRTKADMQKNPEKWGADPKYNNDPDDARLKAINTGYAEDTNPNSTNAIRKFNPGISQQDIENVRQHKLDKPYSNLPGANWGNAGDITIGQDVKKQQALADDKSDTQKQKEMEAEGRLGFATEKTGFGTPIKDNGDLTLAASDLDKGPGGITLSGPSTDADKSNDPMSSLPQATIQRTLGMNPEMVKNSIDEQGNFVPEKYLNTIKSGNRVAGEMVEDLAKGKLPINGNSLGRMSASDPTKLNPLFPYIAAAKVYDESFDPTKYDARRSMRIDYESGQTNKMLSAGNTAIQHLSRLQDAADALQGGNVQALNKVANEVGVQAQGQPAPMVYQAIANRVSDEVTSYYRFGGGNEADIQRQGESFKAAASNPQQLGVIGATASMMQDKMGERQEKWVHDMGEASKNDIEFFQPKTVQAMEKLKQSTGVADQVLNQGVNNSHAVQAPPEIQTPEQAKEFITKLPPTVKTFKYNGLEYPNPNYRAK